ncbi:MAG TPA: lamin tail domain-containing protein [Verrucomicrobiales bacterium]|nr:lamin tail domain-containing protein [Verrucomicrobiales bacterium]
MKSSTTAVCGVLILLAATSARSQPTVSSISPPPGAVVPSLNAIEILFSEPVSGVDRSDLVINAEAAALASGSGAGPYVFTFTQPIAGEVSVSWDFDHGIAGTSGSGAFVPEDGWTYQLQDTVPPSIGREREGHALKAIVPLPGSTVDHLTQVEVRFSEAVTGVDAADLIIQPDEQGQGGTPATEVEGAGAGPYLFTIVPPEAGNIRFGWAEENGIVDAAGNAFQAETWSVTLAPGERGEAIIAEFVASNASGLLDSDQDSPDWLELYNPGPGTVNLAGWSLTSDPARPGLWVISSKTLAAGQRLVIFASGKDTNSIFGRPHTNFRLALNGGYLGLFSPESPREEVCAFTAYPEQRVDVSYGLTADGDERYFEVPSPGEPNPETGWTEITAAPDVSVSRGFFDQPFTLIISCLDPAAAIRYTLDGSEPLAESPLYAAPLEISATTILRLAAFAPGKVRSATVTHSYLFLEQALSQPEPPYDDPGRDDDDDNPALPAVGDSVFPIYWGSQNGAGFPGVIGNLQPNQVPADYGMDPEIVNDPTRYNDDGEEDPAGGLTNRERIDRAFRELPLLSVVMENEDMFGAAGLHPNSMQKGDRFEMACSLELLLPDGTTGFDTTCGIRLHGNASREPRKSPKHSFKLNFRNVYGVSRLDYALFPGSPSREYDDIILRADFNSSWLHWDGGVQRPKGTRMRDAFCKETFRDMGRAAGHHLYVHLFINGIYWGLYDATEQENNGFAANTFGGSKDDYDVVEQGILKSGSRAAYDSMLAITAPITNEKYEAMKEVLDVFWYADYMLMHFYLGHQDWGDDINKNWYAVRHKDGGQFRYLPWDMENLMWEETVDRTGVGGPPSGLHTKLTSNAQYRLDFADRVHKHLVAPGGALQPAAGIARWNRWRSVIQNAIACESARWGDYRRDVHRHESGPYPLFTWADQWIVEQERITGTWFPRRPDLLLRQLRTRGLYPGVEAPQFKNAQDALTGSRHVTAGFEVKIVPPSIFAAADIYYTTDGSDPRVYYDTSGAPGPGAQAYEGPVLITESTVLRARGLRNGEWSALNEAVFMVGSPAETVRISEIHYNPSGGLGGSLLEFIELINTGALPVRLGGWSFRGVNFVFPWDTVLAGGGRLVIASNDAPGVFHARYPGVVVAGYFGGRLDNGGERLTLVDAKGNVVSSVEYDDVDPWPSEPDNGGPSLEVVDPHGDLQSPFNWRASMQTNGSPGLPNAAPPSPAVVINEFLARSGPEQRDFVEIWNRSSAAAHLGGWTLAVRGEEPVPLGEDLTLGPSEMAAIEIPLAGSWGEVSVRDDSGAIVDGIRYGVQAEGFSFGRTAEGWALCSPTPGAENAAAAMAPLASLRINEWLANPSPGADDWIELVNSNESLPVSLKGLHARAGGEVFQIMAPSAVGPGGFARLYCDRGARRADALLFQLPAAGASLALSDGAGVEFDSVTYGLQAEEISEGRLPDASGEIVPLKYPSPGISNQPEAGPDLRLHEVALLNGAGQPAWIELYAPEPAEADLSGWSLRSIGNSPQSWTIPDGVILPGEGYLAIACDPAAPASAEAGPDLNSGLPLDASYAHWGMELVNPAGRIVDRATWGLQVRGWPIGRLGDGAWGLLESASRGSANAPPVALGDTSGLRINEWFPAGPESVPDASFIEIYNSGPLPVSLEGLWLSDEPSEAGRVKWRIPPLTFIAAGGHAVFFSGSGSARPNWFPFDLARGGEHVRLGAGDNGSQIIDAQGYGRLSGVDQSEGRLPDGGEVFALMIPTPGSANLGDQPVLYAEWAGSFGLSDLDPGADPDFDGLINIIEYLSGTNPLIPATAAEQEAARSEPELTESGGQRFLSMELSVSRSAVYSELTGELSAWLGGNWTGVAPSRVDVLGETSIGTRRMRFEFPVPADANAHFLRMRIVP